MKLKPAVFLDRDGVINPDRGFVGDLTRFEFLPGVPGALQALRRQGFLLVLVTNQSGIARGYYSEADFFRICAYMQQVLALHDAAFDKICYCPHHPEALLPRYRKACNCRKPAPGMLFRAAQELGIDLGASVMIGDRLGDLQAAENAGVPLRILAGGQPEAMAAVPPAAYVCADLKAAAEFLEKNYSRLLQQSRSAAAAASC